MKFNYELPSVDFYYFLRILSSIKLSEMMSTICSSWDNIAYLSSWCLRLFSKNICSFQKLLNSAPKSFSVRIMKISSIHPLLLHLLYIHRILSFLHTFAKIKFNHCDTLLSSQLWASYSQNHWFVNVQIFQLLHSLLLEAFFCRILIIS